MELVKHGANVNEKEKTKGTTPLFHALNYDTVKLLLNYGADPHLVQFTKPGKVPNRAIDYLIKHNPQASKAIFDQCLTKEKKKIDTLVMDFSIFADQRSKPDNAQYNSEMALFNFGNYVEYQNPLTKIFLLLKYQTTSRILHFLHHTIRFIFPITINAIGITYTQSISCSPTKDNTECFEHSNASLLTWSSGLNTCLNGTHFNCEKGYLRLTNEKLYVLEELCDTLDGYSNYVGCWNQSWIYIWTCIMLFIYIIKETFEVITQKSSYIKFKENWIAILVIFSSVTFMTASNFNMEVTLHSASWMVLLVWIDLFLYLGIFDNRFSDYIFIFVDVALPMFYCLISFLPIFFGFTIAFHIVLYPNEQFSGSSELWKFGSFVSVVAMMMDYDYEHFDVTTVTEKGGLNGSAQIMFLFYMIIVSLIVVNLLIAVSVSKTDFNGLKERSKLMRSNRLISELIVFESMSFKLGKPLLKNIANKVSSYSRVKSKICTASEILKCQSVFL